MRILIADDEQTEREAIRLFLSRITPAVQVVGEAENGNQAIELFRALSPDVLLLDIEMGECNGLDAAAAIRAESQTAELVILTAYGSFAYSQLAIRCRVFDYLLKPIAEEELSACLSKLRAHIEQKSQLTPQPDDLPGPAYSGTDERIAMVISFIHANLDQPLSLNQLSELAHTTPEYFSKLFRAKVGVQLSKFIIQTRIEQAKHKLKYEPGKPLKQIAEEVGFTTIQHFSNTFKKYEQLTPLRYREKETESNA